MENTDEKVNKTTIINNVSVKDHPLTTVVGGIFVLIGLGMIVIQFIISYGLIKTVGEVTMFPEYVPWSLMVIGILLLFAPDKIITGLGNFFNKKTDSL